MIPKLLEYPRHITRRIALTVDALSIVISLIFVISLFNQQLSIVTTPKELVVYGSFVAFSLIGFHLTGLYRTLVRFLSIQTLITVFLSSLASSLILFGLNNLFHTGMSGNQIVFYCSTLIITLSASRITFKLLVHELGGSKKEKVLIYGAGAAGRQLLSVIGNDNKYFPIGFIDDNPELSNTKVNSHPVFSKESLGYLIHDYSIKKVLLAIGSATATQRRVILDFLEQYPVEVKTIPSMTEIIEGDTPINQLRDISINDLLGREPVTPNKELMSSNIKGKNVFVTGAGGSIGSELCRQILQCSPKSLTIFDISEYGLYAIDKELSQTIKERKLNITLNSLLGSVQHKNRLKKVMVKFNIHTVYHAAAYKHVPIVEHNVIEGVRNNVFGTWYCALAAKEAQVERFVLISTDKAVRPTNTMGTTKRLAELGLQALAQQPCNTTFCMVRFGNVLGSSGSVVPLFKEQIKKGGPVTVTHKDITRYFMTIPEASQLVLQAGAMGTGGDVFVLDMGEPVKIYDLAKQMIHLSGYTVKTPEKPNGDIAIEFSGLRPGEKLYEELLIGDDVEGTLHSRIMTAKEVSLTPAEYEQAIENFDAMCHQFDVNGIRQLMLKLPTGFNPSDDICDLLWLESETENKNILKLGER